MSLEDRKVNFLLREKILSLDSSDLRIQFFRPDEGMKIYHIGRGMVMDLAEEADALYKVGRCCVIDKELFEKNLQKYKVSSGRKKQ